MFFEMNKPHNIFKTVLFQYWNSCKLNPRQMSFELLYYMLLVSTHTTEQEKTLSALSDLTHNQQK